MPLQELSPPPRVTGLSNLGGVLADVGQTIEHTREGDQNRANQLADVASARDYVKTEGERTYARNRADQLTDVASSRKSQLGLLGLEHEWRRDDEEDARTYAEARAYAEHAQKLKEFQPDKDSAKALSNESNNILRGVRARAEELQRVVTAEPKQVSASDPVVMNLAHQMAGSDNMDIIQTMVPKAVEQLNGEALLRQQFRTRAAQETLLSLKATEQQATDVIQTIMTKFGVVPEGAPPMAGVVLDQPIPARKPLAITPQSFVLGSKGAQQLADPASLSFQAPPPPRAAGTTLADLPAGASPEDLAIQQRGAAAAHTAAQATLQTQLEDETSKFQDIQQQLARVRQGLTGTPIVLGGGMGGAMMQTPNPQQQAAENTRLLQASAAQQQKVKSLIAQLQGPSPTSVNTPAASVPTFSFGASGSLAPNTVPGQWWRTPAGL